MSRLVSTVSFAKRQGRSTLPSSSWIRNFSSHAPAKKEDGHAPAKDAHGAPHAAAHGHDAHGAVDHGHDGIHRTPIKQEIPDKFKKEYPQHLFPFEEGDYIPPTESGAVGDERLELDFGPFDTTVLKGGFGTREHPVEVASRYPSRIVGCTGSENEAHDILWHEVKHGKDLICMECSQVFRHVQIPGMEDLAHGHGHDDHDGHHHVEPEYQGHVDGDGFRFMKPPKTAAQIAKEKAERDEELKKDPKAPAKKVKATGIDYHQHEEHTDEGRLASSSPIFQDRRPQNLKDRK